MVFRLLWFCGCGTTRNWNGWRPITGVLAHLRSREERLLRLLLFTRLRRGLEDAAAAAAAAEDDADPDNDNDDNNDVLRVLLIFEDEEEDKEGTEDNSAFLYRWLWLRIRVRDAEVRIVESNSEDKAAASLAFPPVPATAGNEAVFLV